MKLYSRVEEFRGRFCSRVCSVKELIHAITSFNIRKCNEIFFKIYAVKLPDTSSLHDKIMYIFFHRMKLSIVALFFSRNNLFIYMLNSMCL